MGNFIEIESLDLESGAPLYIDFTFTHEGNTFRKVFHYEEEDWWEGVTAKDDSVAYDINVFPCQMDMSLEYNIFKCTQRDEDTGMWSCDMNQEVTGECDVMVKVFLAVS